MARKAVAKSRRPRAGARGGKTSILAEEKHIGYEIVDWSKVDKDQIQIAMRDTLRHYGYFYGVTDAAKWVRAYARKHMTKTEQAALRKLEDWQFTTTIGGMCKMLENGAPIPEGDLEWVNAKLKSLVSIGKIKIVEAKAEKDEVIVPKKSPAEILKEKTSEFIAEVEEILDLFYNGVYVDVENYSVYNELQKITAAYNTAKAVADYYRPIMEEVVAVVAKQDKELVEAYAGMTPKKRKALLVLLKGIVEDAEKYMAGKKAVRKPRTKRVKTASAQIAKLQYAKDSAEYKVTSVDPNSIVGASKVFLFNTKYRKLTMLVTSSREGFEVKGTTIQNIDAEQSGIKMLRKPSEVLSVLLKATPAKSAKMFKEIKTKVGETTGRVNGDTIIVKVIK